MTKKNDSAIQFPRSVASVAAKSLEKEIIEDRLKPGERLIEETWAAKFGISQGSFREALRILEHANLVEILPRRGARVAELKKKDAQEIYFLRKHLLGLAFASAAKNMSPATLSEFKKILGKMEDSSEQLDSAAYFRSSVAFDDLALEVANIGRLKLLLDYLGKPTLRYRFIGFQLPGRLSRSLTAHQNIVAAFARRDPDAAGEEVSRVIGEAGEAIIHHLFDRPTDDEAEATTEDEAEATTERENAARLDVRINTGRSA